MRPAVARRAVRSGRSVMRAVLTGIALLFVMGLGLPCGPAYAHDSIVSSDPVEGSEIIALPPVITITFDGPPQGPTAKVGVLVGDAKPVTMEGTLQGNNLLIDTAAPELAERVAEPAGPWVVSYQIVSSDGDPVTGSVSFTVQGEAAPGSGAADVSAPGDVVDDTDESGVGWWVYVLIGVAAIGAAAVVARLLTRRPPSE